MQRKHAMLFNQFLPRYSKILFAIFESDSILVLLEIYKYNAIIIMNKFLIINALIIANTLFAQSRIDSLENRLQLEQHKPSECLLSIWFMIRLFYT